MASVSPTDTIRLGLQPLTGRPDDGALSATLWTRSQFTSSSDGMDLKQVTLADRLKNRLPDRTYREILGKPHEFYPTQGDSITFTVCGPVRELFYNAKKDDKPGNAKASKKMANT